MTYTPLNIGNGRKLTAEDLAHMETGIIGAYEYADDVVAGVQAGTVSASVIDDGIDRAVTEGRIPTVDPTDLTGYATETYVDQSLVPYATETYVTEALLAHDGGSGEPVDLSAYALKSELHDAPDLTPYALKADVPAAPDLSGYALKTDIPEVPPAPDLSPYALKTELPEPVSLDGLATETFVNNAVANVPAPDLSAYALAADVPAPVDLTPYALAADVPAPVDLSGYATETFVQNTIDAVAVEGPQGPQGPVGIVTGTTPPASPVEGQLWLDTSPQLDLTTLPGILGAWRAEDVPHLATGQGVQYVPSLVGLRSPLFQSSAGNRPTMVLDAVNSRPALRFTKTSSQSMEAPLPNVSGPLTVVSVFQCSTNETAIYSSGDAKYVTLFYGASNFASLGSGADMTTHPGNLSWNIVVQVIDGASSRVYWTSTASSPWTVPDQGGVGFQDALRVGNNSGTMFSNALIGELALYGRGLSDGEVRGIFAELAPKYGVTV